MANYARFDIAFERGEGVFLYDTDGRRYLDFGAGIAVSALGHAHPALIDALNRQGSKLWHTSNLYRVPEQERLADRLTALTFADRAFFCNSGAEAWEAGLKMARRYHAKTGAPQRHRMITFTGGFHGRTMAGISATAQEKLIDGFGPLLPGFDIVEKGDIDAVAAAITGETAAICLEPILGEGGIQPFDNGFIKALRALADDHGILLFFDEIQTGFARTGQLFAHEWAGVDADLMCVAKGMAGGFPVGAVLATEPVAAAAMTPGAHGTTFGGNPLAMAVANAALDILSDPVFLAGVRDKAARLDAGLSTLWGNHPDLIAEVRGVGLMRGIKLAAPYNNAETVKALNAAGLLTVAAGDNVVRILPPLIITETEIDEGLAVLDRVLNESAATVAHA